MRAGSPLVEILSPEKTVVPVGATFLPTVTVPGVTTTPNGGTVITSASEKGTVAMRAKRERTTAKILLVALVFAISVYL
jgi:hypothetical protein